jgi:transposase
MSPSSTLSVGMDVHQESIAVAYVTNEHHAEVVDDGALGTCQDDLDQVIRTRPSNSTPLVLVDEAGPCGDWLHRDLSKQGSGCWVVAPACIPQQAGDHVNTARRDAIPLARLMRADDLTPVDVPTGADAAMRDLRRARAEALRALNAAQSRLQALLRRQAIRSTGQAHGSPAHRRWRAEVVCPPPLPHSSSARTIAGR